VLDASKDYHRGAPAIDRLVFRPVPELTTRVAALLSGQADLVSDIPPDQVEKVKASGVARIEVSTLGGFIIMMKITNYLMPGPWQDVRVRKAINYAIDMDDHQDRARGYGRCSACCSRRKPSGSIPTSSGTGTIRPGQTLLRRRGTPTASR
jgi:peptide/nickel transport system substrate-binding protein